MISEAAVTLSTDDGVSLEAQLALSADSDAGMVICHPHPLYGGDMDNPVVVRIAEVAAALGIATLRFNFRGVGRSTGAHGGGEAERLDITAALGALRSRLRSPSRVVLAGYSFGSVVSASVAPGASLAGLALIAPPLAMTGDHVLAALSSLTIPILVVIGANDDYCPLPVFEHARVRLPRAAVRVIERANHFFFGTLFPLGEALREWLEELELGQAQRRGGAR
jgi:alpha/beta superfamily hydrolase